ncbi:MAG: hypothetical protein J6M36_00215, partial [Prevotella sp.]|nr:hypothetical protein [Prevotella sp.]
RVFFYTSTKKIFRTDKYKTLYVSTLQKNLLLLTMRYLGALRNRFPFSACKDKGILRYYQIKRRKMTLYPKIIRHLPSICDISAIMTSPKVA